MVRDPRRNSAGRQAHLPQRQSLYDPLRDAWADFHQPRFADLYDHRGRPAEAPARLAMVLVFQHIEQLGDAEAADAVRARLDWKYALALDLDDPGFDATMLGDVRTWLLAAGAEKRLLTLMLETLVDAGLLKACGHQRSDATHVLANIRTLTRLTLVAETLRHAFNDLAEAAPDWLAAHLDPAWSDRSAVRVAEYRLPKDATLRQLLVETVSQDGSALLTALREAGTPPEVLQRPTMQTLRTVWLQQYYGPHDIRWRSAEDLPRHKGCERLDFVVQDTLGRRKPTCNTFLLL